MKDFLFIYRMDYNNMPVGTPAEIQAMTQKWMDWIGTIAGKGKLGDRGNRLHNTGKTVKPGNVVTNGPYSDIKESIGGYTLVKADSYEEAVDLAKGCPALFAGGNVEVREIAPLS